MTWLVIGGAGFIGGHLMERLDDAVSFDLKDRQDADNIYQLMDAMTDIDTVVHLASNPDLAAAATDPDIDYRNGTAITRNVLEAMRITGVRRLIYASGSGVYGDQGARRCSEIDIMMPVSPYGASKLASEALISAYQHLGHIDPLVLRLANVCGPRVTHGVVHDFIAKLKADPTRLEILGDGKQSKAYVHVADVVDAMLMDLTGTYNVSTEDYLTVTQIADIICDYLNLRPAYHYTGGSTGWPGDVPVIRMDATKIRAAGWSPVWTVRGAIMAGLR
jgi:UDP-glucose 4-epimerase